MPSTPFKGADLVAHVGQKFALGPVGGLALGCQFRGLRCGFKQVAVGVAQLGLNGVAFRDVRRGEGHADAEILRIKRGRGHEHVNDGPVLSAPARLDLAGAFFLDLPVFFPADEVEILLRGIEHARALAQQFPFLIACHFANALVDLHETAVLDHPDACRRYAENGLKMLLAFTQGFLDQLLFGDVEHEAEPGDASVRHGLGV